jgi:excisionase family DNA binding protein
MTEPKRFWTVHEIASRLRVSPMTIYRAVAAEELHALRIGRSIRITERALDEYLRAATTVEFERPR